MNTELFFSPQASKRCTIFYGFLFGILLSPIQRTTAQPPAETAKIGDELQAGLDLLSQEALPGTFAIAVVDTRSKARWGVQADTPMPMMSDFKAPVAATVLERVQQGQLSLDELVHLEVSDCVPGSAVPSIGTRVCVSAHTYTVDQLLEASVSKSDNTAVDALLKLVGGPRGVTDFLERHGMQGITIRMSEREMASVSEGFSTPHLQPDTRADDEKSSNRANGYRAFLAEPPNTATPNAAALFLQTLVEGRLLKTDSTKYLLRLMAAQKTPHRLRDGLPSGVVFADKTGTGASWNGRILAYNDIGLIVLPRHNALIIAAYLRDSTATEAERDALFKKLAELASTRL
ncbi:MAG: class A beta-lactamase [Janthinobacterium lividum]